MDRALTLLAALLVPMTALAADKTIAAADPPAVEEHDAPARPSRSAGEVIDDAKDATNAAIDAAKEAILKAIDEAKENTNAKLDQGKKASEDALDKAQDATSLLDKAAQAASPSRMRRVPAWLLSYPGSTASGARASAGTAPSGESMTIGEKSRCPMTVPPRSATSESAGSKLGSARICWTRATSAAGALSCEAKQRPTRRSTAAMSAGVSGRI